MREVPTTQTALDITLKIRELSDRLSGIKSQKEIAERELTEVVSSISDVNLRMSNLESKIDQIGKLGSELSEGVTDLVLKCDVAVHESDEMLRNYVLVLAEVSQRLDERVKAMDDIERQAQDRLDQVIREEKVLGTRQQDLDVYKRRLEQFIKDNNIPIQLIV